MRNTFTTRPGRDRRDNDPDTFSGAAESAYADESVPDESTDAFDLYRHFHPDYAFRDDSYGNAYALIGAPKRRITQDLRSGDVVLLRQVLSGRTVRGVIGDPELFRREDLSAYNARRNGYYIRVSDGSTSGDGHTYIRLTDTNSIIPSNLIVLRRTAAAPAQEDTGSIWDSGEDYAEEDPAPTLLARETAPARETLYVSIDLGLGRECVRRRPRTWECLETLRDPVEAKTGIFIPQDFTAASSIDLLIYLHGHKSGFVSQGHDQPIDRFWNASVHPRFAFRELLNASGRNLILVAPTLGPLSQAGNLTTGAGFNSFVTQVLAAIAQHSSTYRGQAAPTVRSIILAAHSGGGQPMRRIARLTDSTYAALITQCWGFDCTYSSSDPDEWYDWAQSNPGKSLYLFSIAGTSTATNANRILQNRTASNIHLVRSSTGDHNSVPQVYLRERLAAIGAPTESYNEEYESEAACACGGHAESFDEDLVPNTFCTEYGVLVPATQLRQQIAAQATSELTWWTNAPHAQIMENTAAGRQRITTYWGLVPGAPTHTVPGTAWSAVFVSSCVRLASEALGVTPIPLLLSAGHFHYAKAAYNRRFHTPPQPGYYWAYDPADRVVQVGDIIVKERQQPNGRFLNLTFDDLRTRDGASTHGDIVVSLQSGRAQVIGGNVSNSVRQNEYILTTDGKIDTTQSHNSGNRVFAVLSLQPLEGCIQPASVPSSRGTLIA